MNSNSYPSTRRPSLVCDLCKSEFATNTTSQSKCFHTDLTGSLKNQRYYEILTHNFRETLAKVKHHSDSLTNNIQGSEKKIASYYDKIRLDIDASVKEIIEKIMAEKRKLFTEVDRNQRECTENFKSCSTYKKDMLNYLSHVNEFTSEWRNQKIQPNESILEAFKKGYALKIELERKKIQYESFIFNKKIEFVRPECIVDNGCLKVGHLIKIVDHLPKFEEWKRIDLKQRLFLSLKNGDAIRQPYMIVEEFESKNLFCCYVYKNPDVFGITKIKLVVSDANGNYLRSLNEHTYANEFKVYKFKDLILVSLYSEIGHSNLKLYDENLNRIDYIESLSLVSPITTLFANDNGIYLSYTIGVESGHETAIYALNWDLEYVETTGPNKMIFPFYFPNTIDQIEYHDQKFYLKFENTVTVVNEENGEIMKVLDIPCVSDMAIDTSGFLVIYCRIKKKLFYLNLNCDILDENDLGDFPTHLKFYYNKYERTIFFYDNYQYILYKMPSEKKLFKNSIHWYLKVNE